MSFSQRIMQRRGAEKFWYHQKINVNHHHDTDKEFISELKIAQLGLELSLLFYYVPTLTKTPVQVYWMDNLGTIGPIEKAILDLWAELLNQQPHHSWEIVDVRQVDFFMRDHNATSSLPEHFNFQFMQTIYLQIQNFLKQLEIRPRQKLDVGHGFDQTQLQHWLQEVASDVAIIYKMTPPYVIMQFSAQISARQAHDYLAKWQQQWWDRSKNKEWIFLRAKT